MPARRPWFACASSAVTLAITLILASSTARPALTRPLQRCAAKPTAVLAPQVPADVCIPDDFTGIAVDYFDDYSWRAFVALMWPAATGQRGTPAVSKPITAVGPRVFETFKTTWEIFHPDGAAPLPVFDRYDGPGSNPCAVTSGFGDVTIGSASGIDDIGQAGIGVLDPPVAAQNGRYIRTLMFFNRVEFDHIVSHRYYLRSELPPVPTPRPETPVITFPNGSIALKASWIDVRGLSPALVKRFYTRTATVKRANGEGCEKITVGLLGLHIAQKTPSRPQWIWSSFEQKDLVPPRWPDTPDALALNDGTQTQMPQANPLSLTPLAPEPVTPFNIVRDAGAQILTSTDLMSYRYQALLAGTPFQFYRLVMTQWPRLEGKQTDPIPPAIDGSITNTFPGAGAFSAFANVTMETFDQNAVQRGCMSCHNRARMTADFMWSVFDHAFPSRLTPGAPRHP